MGNLTRLEFLFLEGTCLSELPQSLTVLKRLRWLALPDNSALGLPKELLEGRSDPAAILEHYFRGIFGPRAGQSRTPPGLWPPVPQQPRLAAARGLIDGRCSFGAEWPRPP
jgi:hypothetical protein